MSKPQPERRGVKVLATLALEHYIEGLHCYGIDPARRELYLMGEDAEDSEPGVNHVMANRLIKNLRALENAGDEPITIHMKTCGGDMVEGLAIYDALTMSPCSITIINYTHARSMSSVIFQAADQRIMMPHSYCMIHEGTISVADTMKGVRSAMEFDTRYHSKRFMDIYIRRMQQSGCFKGKPRRIISRWLVENMDKKQEVYLTPREAVLFGLADSIVRRHKK